MSATDQEKSELLCRTIERLDEALSRFALQNGVFLVVIGGWVISSDTAQAFLSSSLEVKAISSALLVTYSGFHALWVYQHKSKSELAVKYLVQLDYLPVKYVEPHRIRRREWVTIAIFHSICSFVICALILFPQVD